MVEFEYQPWKKIIAHEVVKFPLQHFLSQQSLGVQQGGVGRPITWADGIIFLKGGLPDTDEVVKDKLNGILHWNFLQYTILEKYQPEFKVAGNIRIPVIDVSDNETFKKMVVWIKNNFEKK